MGAKCHSWFLITILIAYFIFFVIQWSTAVYLIVKFIHHYKNNNVPHQTLISKKLCILCITCTFLFCFTSIGQFIKIVTVQSVDCDKLRSLINLSQNDFSVLERIGEIIIGLTYIPAFVVLYSLFSLKLITMFKGTVYAISKTCQNMFKTFRIMPIALIGIACGMFFIRRSIGLALMSVAIVCLQCTRNT